MKGASLPLIAAVVSFSLACGSASTQPTAQAPAWSQHTTAHFVFHYTTSDAASIAQLAAAVEEQSRRVTMELGAGEMAPVHVHLYETHQAMADAVRGVAGPIPSWASGLVTAADRIHLMSPGRTGVPVDRAAVSALHEFAHCVTLHIEPASGNNPRWLWEAVALFEAGQRVDPRTLSYMTAGQVPTLAALSDASNRQIYEVGFLLGEFIVETGGIEGLRSLIVHRGDTARVLGLDTRAFEARWREFLETRYAVAR